MDAIFMNNFPHPSDFVGFAVEDFIARGLQHLSRRQSGCPRRNASSSDSDDFKAHLNLRHFRPEEINVKVSGNIITVEAKHEEREDEQGSVSRDFVRKYKVPEGHDLEKIETRLASDGVLTILVPKIEKAEEGRNIPVVFVEDEAKDGGEKKENVE